MKINLKRDDLILYTSTQLNSFFPDSEVVTKTRFKGAFDIALNRIEHCFNQVNHARYNENGKAVFNYLYSDHYVMYLWYLSNSVWRDCNDINLASKLYYLNKVLHSFDCMYDTDLPDIFLVFHSVGTMLGKAKYNNYFVVLQGVTVGSHKGEYPVFGKGVSITANSSVIGKCEIGDRVSVSTRTSVFSRNIEADNTIYTNPDSGIVEVKSTKIPYAQQFFHADLSLV